MKIRHRPLNKTELDAKIAQNDFEAIYIQADLRTR